MIKGDYGKRVHVSGVNGALFFCHTYLRVVFAAADSQLANQLHRNVAISVAS